jgi:signal transduction histidine kinase
MSVENPIVLIENRVVSGSGEIRWMQFVNRGFFDEEEQLIEIQSVGRDITELKLVEEALKISEMTLRQTSSRRLDAFEDERKRIGLELHDGLAQTMSAIKIWAKAAAQKHLNQNNEAKVAESLENVVSLSQRAIEELRRVSKNLHPAVLENLGLLAAIDWLCEETEQLDRSINITRQIDVIENEVPDSLKTVIFRVTQEALNNVFRHSKANLVRISLQKAEREIKLIIEDDGSGFESGPQNLYQKTGHGLGLISMEERTKLAGGTFSIESQLWEGTTIKAVWPL